MSAPDALQEKIARAIGDLINFGDDRGCLCEDCEARALEVADAVLAVLAEDLAAYVVDNRIVTTAEDLDALTVGSVIRLNRRGTVWEKLGDDGVCGWASPSGRYFLDPDHLPATVLYEPEVSDVE